MGQQNQGDHEPVPGAHLWTVPVSWGQDTDQTSLHHPHGPSTQAGCVGWQEVSVTSPQGPQS